MERAIRTLRAPVALIDRAEAEQRLPPGAGLMIAFGASFVFYAALIFIVA
jgi:hypothetical protein